MEAKENYPEREEQETSSVKEGRADFYPFNQAWLDGYYKSKGIK